MAEVKKDYNNLDQFTVEVPEKRLEQLQSLITSTFHNLEKISRVVSRIEQEQKKELYRKMPGVEGTFDGVYLVEEGGAKTEVPPNYAAKSRLVYGDKLKIVEENGKQVFKQIDKSERKEIKGVLSKKEGKWYLLADSGTYKISDTAAEFNKAQLNEEAIALVPADNQNVPFAALDKIERKEEPKEEVVAEHKVERKPVIKLDVKPIAKPKIEAAKPEERVIKPPFIRPVTPKQDKPREEKKIFKPLLKKPRLDKPFKAPERKNDEDSSKKEFVDNLMSDDDLR